MSIQDLRSRALAYGLNRVYEFPICLDDAKRKQISDATNKLVELYNQRPSDGTKPSAALAKKITTAENRLTKLEEDTADDTVVLRWKRLDPDEYAAIEAEARSDDTYTYLTTLWPLLLSKSFDGVYSREGENLDIDWETTKKRLLSPGDIDGLAINLVAFNREQTTIPFDRAGYGPRDMN